MIKIGLVEDNRTLRTELKEKLNQEIDCEVIFSVEHGKDMIEEFKLLSSYPDVILMDIQMPVMNGIDATEYISTNFPTVKVIMLTIFGDDDHIIAAIQAGAKGYILKQYQNDLKSNILDILNGGAPMSPSVALKALTILQKSKKTLSKQTYNLTSRETDVLKELSNGSSYKEIGLALNISLGTVKKHLENIYKKLQARNKVEAIQKSRWLGLF